MDVLHKSEMVGIAEALAGAVDDDWATVFNYYRNSGTELTSTAWTGAYFAKVTGYPIANWYLPRTATFNYSARKTQSPTNDFVASVC